MPYSDVWVVLINTKHQVRSPLPRRTHSGQTRERIPARSGGQGVTSSPARGSGAECRPWNCALSTAAPSRPPSGPPAGRPVTSLAPGQPAGGQPYRDACRAGCRTVGLIRSRSCPCTPRNQPGPTRPHWWPGPGPSLISGAEGRRRAGHKPPGRPVPAGHSLNPRSRPRAAHADQGQENLPFGLIAMRI